MKCPKCGGPTWDNRQRKRKPQAPDFKCKKDGKDGRPLCDGAIWLFGRDGKLKKEFQGIDLDAGASSGNGAAANGNNGEDRSARIERQHSQEMALRYLAIKGELPEDKTAIRALIDWFQRDVGHTPVASGKPAPEREPEPASAKWDNAGEDGFEL